ncbi:hypothetical protein O6H91_Y351800 [Diphasiastrum complanatum]|nr:hypothetical protein O6H91_Y351800 [Diphasiastrum complanatum]
MGFPHPSLMHFTNDSTSDAIIIDDFVARRGGFRQYASSFQRDSGLGHYLRHFLKNEICVAHSKLSPVGESLIIAVKALSFYLGGHKFVKTNKIIFVKRSYVLNILGFTDGNVPLRSSHYSLYSTYIELSGNKDNAHLLDAYARREFLHDNTNIESDTRSDDE